MNLEKLKKEFDSLSEREQWDWLLNRARTFQDKFEISLDNDNTTIHFFEDKEADYMLYFKDDIGNRCGVEHVLKSLGFNADGV